MTVAKGEETVIVWTQPNCVQCTQTKRTLDKIGVKYEEKNLHDNPEQTQAFVDAGLKAAPIVQTTWDTWSGFRLDKIMELVS